MTKLEEKVARLWPLRHRAPMFARALRIAVDALQRERISILASEAR